MIYFDNSATTKIAEETLETYVEVSKKYFGNPSSLHELGNTASNLMNYARKQIANLLNVSPTEIYFTSGGTEGDNWAIKGTALSKRRFGKHIITTSVEHPAVTESMQQLEQLGFDVTYLPVNNKGIISVRDLKNALRRDTILVSIVAVNSEIGAVQPIEEIGEILMDYPAVHYHVDAVQAIGKIPVPLGKDSRIDLAVYSGHKFEGPRGTGFIYIKDGIQLEPLLSGGGQEKKLRSGTENLPAIVAMAKAVRLTFDNIEEKQKNILAMKDKLYDYLSQKEEIHIFSDKKQAPHIICFGIKNIRGEVVVHALEEEGIFVSTTSACSSKALDVESSTLSAMNIPKKIAETAIRVSFSPRNTMEELNVFCEKFDQIVNQFKVINQ